MKMKRKAAVLFLFGLLLVGMTGCSEKKEEKKGEGGTGKEAAFYSEYGFEEEGEALAFPGAEGYGKYTAGGRGGQILVVTNLNDSGEGSLRAAIETKGPRVIVFAVSGDIFLESNLRIKEPNVTIAGQTAPGDGICLRNWGLIVETEEAIVRYLRIRPANVDNDIKDGEGGCDALWVNKSKQVVIDHVSTSFGTDETLSVSDSDQVTVQNCIIAESLNKTRLGTHGMGSLIRGSKGQKVTFYGNLLATHRSRMPMCGNYTTYEEDPEGFYMEFINNVVYNWNSQAAGKNHDVDCVTTFNLIHNVYIAGPESDGNYAWSEGCAKTHMYMSGNSMNGEIPEDQYSLVQVESDNTEFSWDAYKLDSAFEHSMTENILATEKVQEAVLLTVGDSISRDSLDEGVLQSVQNKTGKLINKPEEAAGWTGDFPKLASGEPYADEDKDGMADEWEKKAGLDPKNGEDGIAKAVGDYTNLEIFLQSLCQ